MARAGPERSAACAGPGYSLEDESPSEVLLSSQRIVSLAAHREVLHGFAATQRMGPFVVELQKACLATALPKLIDKGALQPVAVPHLASYRSRAALARKLCT